MPQNKNKKTLLEFWEEQMKQSHTSSNYFFRKSPSHYHMMLLVMSAYKEGKKLSIEYFNEDGDGLYPMTVKIVGKGSLYDPKNEKVRT